MNIFRFRFCTTLVLALALAATLLPSAQAQTRAINWSSYYSIPTTGTTPSSPSSVVYQGQLYLFTRGFDNNIHYNVFNGSWGPYLTVPGGANTSSAPRPVVFNGILYVFTRGYGDSKIYYNSFDGSSWSTYKQVSGNATAAAEPTPVVEFSTLWLINQGAGDRKFYDTTTVDTSYWSPYTEVIPGGATSSSELNAVDFTEGPSNNLFTFFRGSDNGVRYALYSVYNDGYTYSAAWNNYYAQVPNVFTDSGAAPVTYNGGNTPPIYNDLFLFSKGVGSGQINYSMLNQAQNSWFGPFQIPYGPYGGTVSTSAAPSAVVFDNLIFVFQRGTDNKIYLVEGQY